MSSNQFTVSLSQAKQLIKYAMKARIVPILESAPGMGKSSMIKSIAEEAELLLLDERLSTMEPTDLNGFPSIYEVDVTDPVTGAVTKEKRAGFIPFENWPLDTTPLPINPKTGNPYKGWLLFLDEIRSATPTTQAAAYRVLLDREIGKRKLHNRCFVVGASNTMADNAQVFDSGTAFQSRVMWISLHSSLEEWMTNFALPKNLDSRVIGYLNWKGISALNNFNPDHDEKNFACERTWETLARYIKNVPAGEISYDILPALVGIVGQSTAVEFRAYTSVYQNLITLPDILANPLTVHVDTSRPDIMWATVSMIQTGLNAANVASAATPVMLFINRLPIEYQAMVVRSINMLNPVLMATCPELTNWMSRNSSNLANPANIVAAQPVVAPQP